MVALNKPQKQETIKILEIQDNCRYNDKHKIYLTPYWDEKQLKLYKGNNV